MRMIAAAVCLIFAASSPLESAQQERISSSAEARKGMVLVHGGTFAMGTPKSKVPEMAATFHIEKHPDLIDAETPQHSVSLGAFYLDRHEVTNKDFARFVRRQPEWAREAAAARTHNGNYLKDWHGDDYPKGKGRHPVVNVSWYAAVAFCRSYGKRLPTEAEWEYAARGGLADTFFPWGNAPADPTRANYLASKLGTTTPVGSYPANGYGLFDMAGNVWEFVADEWGSYPSEPQTDPLAGGDLSADDLFLRVTTRRVIRGGSWGGSPLNLRVTYRDSHPPDGARDFVGFRCAASSKE